MEKQNLNLVDIGLRNKHKIIVYRRDETFPNHWHGVFRVVDKGFLPNVIRTKDDFIRYIGKFGSGKFFVNLAKGNRFRCIFKCTIHQSGDVKIRKDKLDQIGLM